MGSINAQRAAHKVVENVRKGKRIKMGEILKEVGYSDAVALHPQRVTETKSYQNALALERNDILKNLEIEIARLQSAIAKKDLEKEEYRTLRGALDLSIKNKALLSGNITSMNVFVLPSEVMTRNAIEQKAPDDLPARPTQALEPPKQGNDMPEDVNSNA